MKYYRYGIMAVLLAAVFWLAACGGGSDLEDVPWKLVSYGESGSPAPALADRVGVITFESENHSFGGNTGCNTFGGDYELDGNNLTVTGPMFQTEMYCGDEADAQEKRVLAILQAAESWSVEGDTLTITSPDGVLVYEKQAGE